jgi:excisionase family DNA binding protein
VTEQLLTAEQVAERLAVPVSWVRSASREGAIPCVVLGRYRRYKWSAVEEWLEACARPGYVVSLRREVA